MSKVLVFEGNSYAKMSSKSSKNCVACGESKSLKNQEIQYVVKPKGFKKISFKTQAEVCSECGEQYFNTKQLRVMSKKTTEAQAEQLAQMVKVADIFSVSHAASVLGMTRQGVHDLINRGKLLYVLIDRQKFILRKSVKEYAKAG